MGLHPQRVCVDPAAPRTLKSFGPQRLKEIEALRARYTSPVLRFVERFCCRNATPSEEKTLSGIEHKADLEIGLKAIRGDSQGTPRDSNSGTARRGERNGPECLVRPHQPRRNWNCGRDRLSPGAAKLRAANGAAVRHLPYRF